jgi:phosphoglycerate dehydrogenase-like enzyme
VPLEDLLRSSLVVSVHLVPTEATRHLLNHERLALMRRDASLINTSRAELVDTDALMQALEQGRIAGAALDVYPFEPLPADHPLRRMPQVLLTPHTGFLSEPAGRAFANGVTDAIAAWLDGKPLPRVVQVAHVS